MEKEEQPSARGAEWEFEKNYTNNTTADTSFGSCQDCNGEWRRQNAARERERLKLLTQYLTEVRS